MPPKPKMVYFGILNQWSKQKFFLLVHVQCGLMFQVKRQARKLMASWGEGRAGVRGVSMKIRHETSSPNDLLRGVEEGGFMLKCHKEANQVKDKI
jgi:hypothetical protein